VLRSLTGLCNIQLVGPPYQRSFGVADDCWETDSTWLYVQRRSARTAERHNHTDLKTLVHFGIGLAHSL